MKDKKIDSLKAAYYRAISFWKKELSDARLQKDGDGEAEAIRSLDQLYKLEPEDDKES